MKKKILVSTGTRAEYGLLRPLLYKIKKSKKLDLLLVVTGTHLSKKYGHTINEIKKDGFKINSSFKMIPKLDDNYSMALELGKGIIKFSKVFKKFKPDLNVILGDRDEMLASALAASHLNIANVHIHGGDISGGIDEYNRHAITKLSNIHFAASIQSKKRILQLGENPKNVFFTGSPGIDEILDKKITSKNQLEKKIKQKIIGNEILLLYHPVTNQTSQSSKEIKQIFKAIVKSGITTFCISPNSDAGNQTIFNEIEKNTKKYDFIKSYANFSHSDYLGLLNNVGLLLGNSSSGLIEASYFNLPVINIGSRQKNRERGKNVVDVKGQSKLIYEMINRCLNSNKKFKNLKLFGDGKASNKMVKILEDLKINPELIDKQINY
jgi:GDP/UDP-N,N'-diacetylbacillosamine 2-epimerase (hydrolysing)